MKDHGPSQEIMQEEDKEEIKNLIEDFSQKFDNTQNDENEIVDKQLQRCKIQCQIRKLTNCYLKLLFKF